MSCRASSRGWGFWWTTTGWVVGSGSTGRGGLAPSDFFNVLVVSSPVQVLIYSGQLDVIVAAPLTERFLPTVNWTGAAEYMKAPRFHWKLQPDDTEVAGYVRSVGEFYQVSGSLISVTSPTPTPALCTNPFFFFFPPRAGHHPWGRAHFALWPTSTLLWHDWQVPLHAGLEMTRFQSSSLLKDSWF